MAKKIGRIIVLREKIYEDWRESIEFDLLVYSYTDDGGYDGSGFAIWNKGRKWFYHEMGHCSCYGPLDNVDKSSRIPLSKKAVMEIAKKNYGGYAEEVLNYIKTGKKPNKKK